MAATRAVVRGPLPILGAADKLSDVRQDVVERAATPNVAPFARKGPAVAPSLEPNFQALPAKSGLGLRLVGELDMATAAELRAALHRLPRDRGGLMLDLSSLSFMDASGLHVLVEFADTLNGTGPLVLDNAPSNLARLFVLTGLDRNPSIELRRGDGRG